MSKFNRMGDWFSPNKGPFDWDPESGGFGDSELEEFEFSLAFPQPPDKVHQSMKLVGGKLVVTFQFVFSEPELLETDDND